MAPMDLERALQLQDEIIQAYKQNAAELRRFAQRNGAAPEARERFLLELQKPIVARYGFEESVQGVKDAMFAFADLAEHNLVMKRNNHMESLLAAGEELDYYFPVHVQQVVRNGGTRRPIPRSQFPLVPREDLMRSVEGRLLPVPRQGMLSPGLTEELVAACARGDVARAQMLLGQCGLVNVGFKALGAAGARTLAQALSPKLEVLELDISGNAIGPEGAKALAAGLPRNLKELKLNLSKNRLTLTGAKAILGSIPKSLEVLALGFSGMKLGPAVGEALAEAMPQVRELSLDLYGNKLKDEGVDFISKALPKTLEKLDVVLDDNDLTWRGFFLFDRQIGDPLHERHLPKLKPEHFSKTGAVDIPEFRTLEDGRVLRS